MSPGRRAVKVRVALILALVLMVLLLASECGVTPTRYYQGLGVAIEVGQR